MKTYHLRGKERREAKVFLKRVQAIAKAIQSPLGRWAWHMAKEKHFAFHAPVPNYPLGSVQPEGEHLIGKDYRPELISKPK